MASNKFSYDLTKQADLLLTVRAVAEYYYGAVGTFVYDAYEFINARYYGGDLPVPMIQVGITPFGHCLGLTKSRDGQPKIGLHPSAISPRSTDPLIFGYSADSLGIRFAYDVLLHELVHVAANYLYGVTDGDSSHNNSTWIAEINRLSPLIGLDGVQAEMTKVKRVSIPGETKTGKPATKPAKVNAGNTPLDYISRWPHPLFIQRDPDYYRRQPDSLPFAPTVGVSAIHLAAAVL